MSSLDMEAICHKWVDIWSQQNPDASRWTVLYTPTATYTDHAFGVKRTGHVGLAEHFNIWRTSMPDFVMELSRLAPVEQLPNGDFRCSLRTTNRGTFVKDLPSKKAAGKPWFFFAVVDLVIRKDGLIESVDEWYTKDFDRFTGPESYVDKDWTKA